MKNKYNREQALIEWKDMQNKAEIADQQLRDRLWKEFEQKGGAVPSGAGKPRLCVEANEDLWNC